MGELEKKFFEQYCSKNQYGEYYYLIDYFVSTYRTYPIWNDEILPYLRKLKTGEAEINDWNSFSWGGKICFRRDYVMILDGNIYRDDRRFPPLKAEDGSSMTNGNYEVLEDTEFIAQNYQEFVKIDLQEFISICEKWVILITYMYR